MKAPERRCPHHEVDSTDLVGYSSNDNAPVYRCLPPEPFPSRGGFHMPHYFEIQKLGPVEAVKRRKK